MEELKAASACGLTASRDFVVAYRLESYDMFEEMSNSIREIP